MNKQPVGQLPDLTQSNNDDEIMVITNDEYNQLKKEKISDFITDLTSTDENNAIVKGTDGKLFTKDFGNASNITEGTLPVSVLPDIPKDKLPQIETNDLPDSGITAGTYTYPTDIVVNSKGQVTSITEGQAGANNANQDLSNLGPLGLDKLNQSKALETGSVSSDADVYADVLKYKNSGTGTGIDTIKPDNYEVVGTPTITDDGIASGFSTANYIPHGITINSSDDFEIIIPVKLNQLSNLQYIAHFIDTSALRQEGNIIAFNLNSTEATAILPYFALVSNVQIDTKYYCKLKKVGNTYIAAYKTNDIDWVIVKNVTSNLTMHPITSLVLGNSADKQRPLTDGEIDLNDIQVYINGNLVYQPCLKIPYTESKTGSKIVDAAYRDRVQDLYEQTGEALYYTIDEENENFTLPMGEIYGMIEKKNEELNNPFSLFDSKYSETPVYNLSWLLSDGTYYSKSVYVTAYEALVVENNSEIEAGTSVTLPSGGNYVKRGLSVKLSTADDITDYDFVINTTDETFRLPLKTKLASGNQVMGTGIALGLTNGTANYGLNNLYLYFYVGETTQSPYIINYSQKLNNDASNLTEPGKTNIKNLVYPDFNNTVSLPITLNLVQQADKDCYLNVNARSGSDLSVVICDADGVTKLILIASDTVGNAATVQTSPLIPAGTYFKVSRNVGTENVFTKIYTTGESNV